MLYESSMDMCADTLTIWAVTGLADRSKSKEQWSAVMQYNLWSAVMYHRTYREQWLAVMYQSLYPPPYQLNVPVPTKHIVPNCALPPPLTSLSHQCLTAQLVVQSSSASIPLWSLDIQDPIIFSGFEVELEVYFGTFDNAFVTFIGDLNG